MNNAFDFLPDDHLTARRNRRANRIVGALFMAVATVVTVGYIAADRQLREAEAEHAVVLGEFEQQTLRIAQVRELERRQIELTRRAELAASLLEASPRSRLLAELVRLAPRDLEVLEFILDARVIVPPPTAAKTSTRRYETQLRLTAVAPGNVEVAQYIRQLDRCPWFEDVRLVVAEEFESKTSAGRRFTLNFKLADRPLEQLANLDLTR